MQKGYIQMKSEFKQRDKNDKNLKQKIWIERVKENRDVVIIVSMVILLDIVVWLNEILSFSYYLFGAPQKLPINWRDALFLTFSITFIGSIAIIKVKQFVSEREKSRKILEKSEAKYRSIFESTGTASVIIEEDMTISMINSQFERLSGYSKEEVEGKKSWTEFVVKEDVEWMKECHYRRRINPADVPINYEFRFKGRDGKIKNIFLTVGIISKTGQSVASLLDITERKEIERALQESQQRFVSLFESSPEALAYLDEKGTILNINPRFTELFGYTLEEVKGRNIDDGMIHSPDKIEEGKRLTKRSLEGYLNYETIRKKKDGTLFPASLSASSVIIDGQLKGIIALYQDITERQKMIEMIKNSEERFRDLFENANDAIWTADLEGKYITVNSLFGKLLGFKKEELIGKKSIYLVAPESRKESIENYKKALAGESTEYEVVVLNKKGERRIHWERLRPLREKGKIIGVQGIGRDITERKQNERLQLVLYNISKAANSPISLAQLYKTIHQELGTIIDTTNFYIALVDEKEDKIFFPYYQDEKDNNFPVLNLSSNTPTTYVIKTGQPFLINRKQLNGMIAKGH